MFVLIVYFYIILSDSLSSHHSCDLSSLDYVRWVCRCVFGRCVVLCSVRGMLISLAGCSVPVGVCLCLADPHLSFSQHRVQTPSTAAYWPFTADANEWSLSISSLDLCCRKTPEDPTTNCVHYSQRFKQNNVLECIGFS